MTQALPTIDLTAPFRLDGRVAVVTGASSGLGDRFARVLHAAGATVVAAARRTDRLADLAADLGERLVPMTCDVLSDDDCERLIADSIAIDGHLDVLVNNAGIGAPMAAEDEPIAGFRGVVDTNLNAVFLLSQLAGRHMIERRSGVIVNVASVL
jgi:NAD(P)-dependent dehydrogenase (short-subunit alcohol dehydrogenase family)